MENYEILLDDSGESERFGEMPWFISEIKSGHVLGDSSFSTKEEAQIYLNDFLAEGKL